MTSPAPGKSHHAAPATPLTDRARAHVRRALGILCAPGDVHELRILHAGRDGTVSGYFDDLGTFARAAADRDGTGPGIYVTLNPVKPELLARAANRAKPRARETTGDHDVVARRWMLVDVDPVRPSGISATDAEHATALALASEIAEWLPSVGVPAESLVRIDSGNGGHLWLRSDLPNEAESLDLTRRCLAALDVRFSTAAAKVDLTTCNAARIAKLPGTAAKKGDHTADRPHRRSCLLSVPETVVPAPRDALERLADMAPLPERAPTRAPGTNGARFDVAAFIQRHGIDVALTAPWNGGAKWVLSTCPWNAEHVNRSSFVLQHASGAVSAGCHHNGCAGKGWADLRALYGETGGRAPRLAAADPRWDRANGDGALDNTGADAAGPSTVLALSGVGLLQPGAAIDDIERTLRRLAEALRTADPLRRAVIREAAVRKLKDVGIKAASIMVDAALGTAAPDAAPDGQGTPLAVADDAPAEHAVDGAEWLGDVVDVLRAHVVMQDASPEAAALWTLQTYCLDVLDVAPIFAVTSPTMRCGKSTLLSLLTHLVARALPASNCSPSALFRSVEKLHPTLLVDEGDTFVGANEELRGILNAGHTRALAFIIRSVGDDHEPRRFNVFGAKAIALIGKLPGTLADRSIEVAMRRRAPGEQVDRLRLDRLAPELTRLRREATRWAADHGAELRHADPTMPPSLHDRASDNWRALVAIADLCGGDWGRRAREAAATLSGTDLDDGDAGILLLGDVQGIFADDPDADRLPTDVLLHRLTSLPERPWAEWRRGKPLTARGLARLLTPFGVQSKQIRLGTENKHGYARADFDESFSRYLRSTPNLSATPLQPAPGADFRDFLSATGSAGVADMKCRKAAPDKGCSGVADTKPGNGETGELVGLRAPDGREEALDDDTL